jgi:hypothetical protein
MIRRKNRIGMISTLTVSLCILSFLNIGWASPICPPAASCDLIQLRSGNGSVGSTDSRVSFLPGNIGGFDFPFTETDFESARNGNAAYIVPSAIPEETRLPSLTVDPLAKWVSTRPFDYAGVAESGLYAITFNLPAQVSVATFDLFYTADNDLGGGGNSGPTAKPSGPNNIGLYMNGLELSLGDELLGTFLNQEYHFTRLNIANLLHAGRNTLYFNVRNMSGVGSGVLFHAEILTSRAVPEPSTWALLLAGVIGFGLLNGCRVKRNSSA